MEYYERKNEEKENKMETKNKKKQRKQTINSSNGVGQE